MDKKWIIALIVTILVIGMIGIYFLTNNKSNTDFKVLENLSDLKNDKSTIIKKQGNLENKFYIYDMDNQKYIVFRIQESTYKSSIHIKNIKLINSNYKEETLNIKLKIDVKEGEPDPLRDWPLYDVRYIVMKVKNNIEKLYVNGYEYQKI